MINLSQYARACVCIVVFATVGPLHAASNIPASSTAPVPTVSYQSAFETYKPITNESKTPDKSWRAANDAVGAEPMGGMQMGGGAMTMPMGESKTMPMDMGNGEKMSDDKSMPMDKSMTMPMDKHTQMPMGNGMDMPMGKAMPMPMDKTMNMPAMKKKLPKKSTSTPIKKPMDQGMPMGNMNMPMGDNMPPMDMHKGMGK